MKARSAVRTMFAAPSNNRLNTFTTVWLWFSLLLCIGLAACESESVTIDHSQDADGDTSVDDDDDDNDDDATDGDTSDDDDDDDVTDGDISDGDDASDGDSDDDSDGDEDENSDGDFTFTWEVIGDGIFTADETDYSYQLLKLANEAGGYAYAQWFHPPRGTPAPTVLVTQPYPGIDWTGEEVDERWAALPGAATGITHPDVDGPGGGAEANAISFQLTTPEKMGDESTIWLWNGFGVLHVFGRFYAGGDIWNDVQDMVAGLRFLEQNEEVDKSHVATFGGSWGGFEALYAAAYAPETIVPVAAVPLAPPSNFTRMVAHILDTPAQLPNPVTAAMFTDFFDPYLRRITAATGGLPGEAGADFSRFSLATLTQRLTTPTLIPHDDWDTLVPFDGSVSLVTASPVVQGALVRTRNRLGLVHGNLGPRPKLGRGRVPFHVLNGNRFHPGTPGCGFATAVQCLQTRASSGLFPPRQDLARRGKERGLPPAATDRDGRRSPDAT